MTLLLKDLIAAGIGLKTANIIIETLPHRANERWWNLVNLCIEQPGTLNTITGYEKPHYLGNLFADDPPKPKNIHPSEEIIIEKLIRWAYDMPTIQPINMTPYMMYQFFPREGAIPFLNHDIILNRASLLHIPLIKHYCNKCHEYSYFEIITLGETKGRGGYNYKLDVGNYLACKECYPYIFEGLGSLFG